MQQLREIREAMNLSLRNFAKMIDVPHSTLQHSESGRRKCSPDLLSKAVAKFEQEALRIKTIADRVDENTPHGVPNAAKAGEW